MSIFSVSNTNDSGAGSLRQAILDANAKPEKDIINFDGLFSDNLAHTITLGGSSLQITDSLTINGIDASKLTVSGGYTSRVFEISSGVTANIAGLTIADGAAYDLTNDNGFFGGGIYNSGTLVLTNSNIFSNYANYSGAGIYNSGFLTISNSTINKNSIRIGGEGSGIYNVGNLVVNNTTINNNGSDDYTVPRFRRGGGIFNGESGIATISDSIITNNFALFTSGGISNAGILTLNKSTVSGNQGFRSDGGIGNSGTLVINNSTITDNQILDAGFESAGGIFNRGIATVTNSTISNNFANIELSRYVYGVGGIYNIGTFTLISSTVSGNSSATNSIDESQLAGGIYNTGTIVVTSSTIRGNSFLSFYGAGGISNDGGSVTVINSTLSENSGIAAGGIYNYNGTLFVSNSTITFNLINTEAFVNYNHIRTSGGINGDATISNNIIAGNYDFPNAVLGTDPDVYGTYISNGHNLIGVIGSSVGFNTNERLNVPLSNVIDTTLQDNGGPTQTYALVIGSPAINAGLNADVLPDSTDLDGDGNTTEPIPYDQRGAGFNRIYGTTVDIGAYELQENVINGTKGNDTINGTAGNDMITGLRGRDILSGGDGADLFVYSSIQDLGDTITDFEVGTDKIFLRQLFGSLNLSNLDYANAITDGYLQFTTQGSNTVVSIDPDGTAGKGRAVKLVTVNNVDATRLNNSINFAF